MTRLAIVKNQFDYARAAASYRDAFAAYGLELKPGQTPEPARRIRDEAPAIRDALIVALDDWAYSVASSASAKAELSAQHLRTIAATADDDPWRRKFRAAVTGNDRAALRSLSAEARESSLPPSCLVLLANTLYLPAEREEALALLRWGRSQHPTDFWVQYNLGGLLNRKTDATPVEVEEAIGCFRAAIALRPRASIVHLSLGLALHAKKQLDEAIAEYRAAIDLDPKDARPHYNLGSVLQAKNQLDEAIAEYRMAIKLDPTDAEAHTNLGIALVAKAKSAEAIAEQLLLDEAIAEFRAAIDIDSNLALAYNGLGTALTGKNQLDDAIANFHKAIKIDPKLGAQFNLGLIFTGKRQLDDAIIAYREAIHWKPDMFEAHNALGLALRDKGALQDAVKAFQKAADLKPDNAMVHSNLAGVLRATGQREKSIEAYRKALELWRKLAAGAPKNAGYQSAVGATLNDLAIARKNPAEAARLLEEAVTYQKSARLIDPDNPRYRQFLRNHYSNLAETLIQLRKHDEAARVAAEIPILHPDRLQELVQPAYFLARCAALAAKDGELPEEKRKEVVNRYGERAVGLLRQAADKGWKNVAALKDPVFEPLRSRDDFQKLVAELKRKSTQ